MKKFFYAITAVSLLLIYGCGKEQNVIEPEKELDLVTYTFTASYAEDEEVRSTLSNGGAFEWVANDDVIAIYNSVTSEYVDFNVVSVDEYGDATIEALASPGAVWTNAIYPAARAKGAGNEVDYTVNSVAGPILVCQVTGQTLSFKYLGSVANIQVTDVPDTPVSLTFTANANVFGCRSFTWGEGADPKPILGGSGTVASITVPFNASGITSVPLPNTSYAGFTITVDNASGRHLYKKSTSNTFDLSSKILLPMPMLNYVAPSKYYVKTISSSKYWDSSDVRMIQTGANSFDLSMNCDGNSTYYVYDEYNIDQPTIGYLASHLAKSSFPTGDSSIELQGYVNSGSWNTVSLKYEGNWHYLKNFKFGNVRNDGAFNYTEIIFKDGSTYWKSVDVFPNGAEYTTKNNEDWNIYVKGIDSTTEYDIFFNSSSHNVILAPSSDNIDPNQASGIWSFSFNNSTKVATHSWKSATLDTPLGNSSFPTTGYGFKSAADDWHSVVNSSTSYSNQSWRIAGISISKEGDYSFGLCDGSSNFWTDLSSDSSFATVNPGINSYGTLTYWRDGSHSNPTVHLEEADYIIFVNYNPNVNGGVNIMFEKQ